MPAPEQKMVATEVIAVTKVGLPITWYPSSKSPVFGAAAGRSTWVTETLYFGRPLAIFLE